MSCNLALAVFPGWTSQLPAAMQGASLPWQSIWGKLPCYIETKSRFKGWQIPDAWGDNFTQLVDLTFDSFLIFFPHLFLRHHATSTWYSRIFRSIWVKYHILPTNGHFHDSPTKPPSEGSAEVGINQPKTHTAYERVHVFRWACVCRAVPFLHAWKSSRCGWVKLPYILLDAKKKLQILSQPRTEKKKHSSSTSFLSKWIEFSKVNGSANLGGPTSPPESLSYASTCDLSPWLWMRDEETLKGFQHP